MRIIFLTGAALFAVSILAGMVSAFSIWHQPPGIGIAHSRLGKHYYSEGLWAEAAAEFESAYKINRGDARSAARWVEVLSYLGKAGEPAAYASALENTTERFPFHADLQNRMVQLLSARGDLDGAIQRARHVTSIAPDPALAESNLGNLLMRRNDFAEAEAAFRRAVSADPSSVRAHYGLGAALYSLGQLDAAQESLNTSLKLNSDLATAHNILGLVHDQRGDIGLALASFERALEIDPNLRAARVNLERLRAATP